MDQNPNVFSQASDSNPGSDNPSDFHNIDYHTASDEANYQPGADQATAPLPQALDGGPRQNLNQSGLSQGHYRPESQSYEQYSRHPDDEELGDGEAGKDLGKTKRNKLILRIGLGVVLIAALLAVVFIDQLLMPPNDFAQELTNEAATNSNVMSMVTSILGTNSGVDPKIFDLEQLKMKVPDPKIQQAKKDKSKPKTNKKQKIGETDKKQAVHLKKKHNSQNKKSLAKAKPDKTLNKKANKKQDQKILGANKNIKEGNHTKNQKLAQNIKKPTAKTKAENLIKKSTKTTTPDKTSKIISSKAYSFLANALEKSPPMERIWSAQEELAWRSGIKHRFHWQRFKTVKEVRESRLLQSKVILWEALDDSRFWTRIEAAMALAEFGVPLNTENLQKVIGTSRASLVRNYFKRFHRETSPGERYVLRQSLQVAPAKARLEILRALTFDPEGYGNSGSFFVAALNDEYYKVRQWATRFKRNIPFQTWELWQKTYNQNKENPSVPETINLQTHPDDINQQQDKTVKPLEIEQLEIFDLPAEEDEQMIIDSEFDVELGQI